MFSFLIVNNDLYRINTTTGESWYLFLGEWRRVKEAK